MIVFQFTGQDPDGSQTTGTVEARSKDEALTILSKKKILVTSLNYVRSNGKGILSWLTPGPPKVSGKDMLVFTEEMAALIEAGIPLKTTMDVLAEDCANLALKEASSEISSGLGAGSSFSEQLRRFPKIFSSLYVAMVTVGEKTGRLGPSLARMARYIENAVIMLGKVKAAMYYPIMVVAFSVVMTTLFFILAIPRVKAIYSDLGAPLPTPTRVLVGFGDFVNHYWYFLLLAIVVLYFLVRKIARTKQGEFFLDQMKLDFPLFGSVYKTYVISRFARTLGSLYGSGLSLMESLEILAQSTGNRVVAETVMNLLNNIRKGESIVEPLRRSKLFTQMTISMMAAGEHSGTLEVMLNKLANFYENQFDNSIKGLSSLVEPIMIILVGILIGTIIICLGLPFLNVGAAALNLLK